MLYKCCDCGEVFDECEAGTVRESRGEFWGDPCYEEMMCCPYCECMELEETYQYDEEEEEK